MEQEEVLTSEAVAEPTDRHKRRRRLWFVLAVTGFLGAWVWWWLSAEPSATATEDRSALAVPPPPAPDQRITPAMLSNTSYALPDGRVTFSSGKQSAATEGITATLSGFEAYGRLNDDPDGDAAVVINQKTSTGTVSYLFGLLYGAAGPVAAEPIPLGTGIVLETLTITNGYVEAAWRAPKAKTPSVKRYWLKEGKLVLDPAFEK